MKTRHVNFLKTFKLFQLKLMAEVQSFLLPAFQNLKFGTPECAGEDDHFSIRGKIFDKTVRFDYVINFYLKADQIRVDIERYQHGALTRIGSTDFWEISGINLSAAQIASMKADLDKKMEEYRA